MISDQHMAFEKWSHNLDAYLINTPNVTWTKLLHNNSCLCNSIEEVEWDNKKAIQLRICEESGRPQGVDGSSVHISRIGDHLLWTQVYFDDIDRDEMSDFDREEFRYYALGNTIRLYGAICISDHVWNRWRTEFSKLPEVQFFNVAHGIDLAAALLHEIPKPYLSSININIDDDIHLPIPLLKIVSSNLPESLLASEHATNDEAITHVQQLIKWLVDNSNQKVNGQFVKASECEGRVETLYLNTDTFEQWPAYHVSSKGISLMFGNDWVFKPELILL